MPFASTSALAPHLVDWQAPGGLAQLERKVIEAVDQALAKGERVTVVLDSVTALAHEGAHEAVSLLRAVLAKIRPYPGALQDD